VRYPASLSQEATVSASPDCARNASYPPSGGALERIRWLWGYRPVSIEVREGQQSDVVTKLRVKVTPWSASSDLTLGMKGIDCASWSSRRTYTMLGWVG